MGTSKIRLLFATLVQHYPLGVLTFFLIYQMYFTEGRPDLSRERAIEPEGLNCFSRGSYKIFLRKHLATCDFQVGEKGSAPFPASGSVHDMQFMHSH